MTRGAKNALWAGAFLDELARHGVRDVCVAPGSRSTPLVLAAANADRFRMFSIVDERSAGFFALGLGKARGRPAAVITTSGTAAANLFPAVIEACQGEVPLLVLTADRPHRLRDTDGNQAMDQLRLFGTFPRAFFEVAPASGDESALRHLRALAARAVATAQGPPRGPVHLNFPFEKPLEPQGEPRFERDHLDGVARGHLQARVGRPEDQPFVRVASRYSAAPQDEVNRVREALETGQRGVIVAGPVADSREVGPAILSLGAATGFPVLADPLSGARFRPSCGAQVIFGYDLFLRSPHARAALKPDLVLRVGGSPTSSSLLDYLTESEQVRQLVLDDGARWRDHLACAHEYIPASPVPVLEGVVGGFDGQLDPGWQGLWSEAEARTRKVLGGRTSGELLEGQILAAVVAGLPDGANLMVASSMPIRDLDAFGVSGSETIHVFGNRGASGIDGLVSTTLGIAEGSGPGRAAAEDLPAPPPTVGVLGDLAFFHDMNGLLALKSLNSQVVFVVVNNDGGGIFHTLPVREHEPAFTRFFTTPHGLDFGLVAELYGLPYYCTSSLEEFRDHLGRALTEVGPCVLEVRTRREATHDERRKVVAAVVAAMEGLRTEEK